MRLGPTHQDATFRAAWFLNGDKLMAAMRPDMVLQVIAVRDIGQYGPRAFSDAARLNRREIDIAGDAATMPAAAEALSAGSGARSIHDGVGLAASGRGGILLLLE